MIMAKTVFRLRQDEKIGVLTMQQMLSVGSPKPNYDEKSRLSQQRPLSSRQRIDIMAGEFGAAD